MIAELWRLDIEYIQMNYDRMVVVGVAFVVSPLGCSGGGIPRARGEVWSTCFAPVRKYFNASTNEPQEPT